MTEAVSSQSCPSAEPVRASPHRVRKDQLGRHATAHRSNWRVDTHTEVHHQAAVIDTIGRHLAIEGFCTTSDGHRRLLAWLRSHGQQL
ncbi:hypothetical protein ACIQAC_34365 [Streptomyces sp. NPDC088387]|uniref:hypothetical protein n=1 Tax=Streptomyces sp. NPDC088387 TaxID=3365859 RepID=UPI003817732E